MTMKAIILTFAPVSEEEKNILRNTNIVKVAINQHAEELKPTYRICSDYGIIGNLLENYSQNVITVREWVNHERLIYAGNISFKGSTMVACIEYLVKDYDDILIIGDNTVHSESFKNRINQEIETITKNNPEVKIYQYRQGNFNLPVESVKEFTERN